MLDSLLQEKEFPRNLTKDSGSMSMSGMSLSNLLPAPAQSKWDRDEERMKQAEVREKELVLASRTAPPYGKRGGWIPRTVEDFGDGGAFPEVHVAQYPLNMGRGEDFGDGGAFPEVHVAQYP